MVAATLNNLVDPTHPWTIFKKPIIRITFVNSNEIRRLDKGMAFTKILWVSYADMSRTEEEIFPNVYDCINNRIASIKDGVSLDRISLSTLKWQDAGTLGADIAKIVCK